MTAQEKARIILEELDEKITISSYMEKYAIMGILERLKRIEEEESKA